MKRFRVELSEEVEEEILDAARFIAGEAPQTALRWLEEVYEAIDSLGTFPERCSLIPENGEFDEEIRELLVHSHRVVFVVDKRTTRSMETEERLRTLSLGARAGFGGSIRLNPRLKRELRRWLRKFD